MRLYHYTCGRNMKLIVEEGKIKSGKILSRVPHNQESAISLTDDVDPYGHGLTNGSYITEEQAKALGYATRDGIRYRSVDNTKYCFVVDIQHHDPKLKKAADYYHGTDILDALEIAGYFPHDVSIPLANINLAKAKFKAGDWKRKGGTWWYYFGDLNLASIANVTIRANTESGWQEWSLDEVEKGLRNG